jgi:hypothetical protein
MNLSSNGRKFATCPYHLFSKFSHGSLNYSSTVGLWGKICSYRNYYSVIFMYDLLENRWWGLPPLVLLTVACVGQAGLALHWRPTLMRWYIADITVAHAFSSSSLSYYSGPVSSSDSRNSSQLLLDQSSSTLKGEEQHVAKNRVFIASSAAIFFLLTWVPIRMGLGMLFLMNNLLQQCFEKV